jgi:hypothetical protein
VQIDRVERRIFVDVRVNIQEKVLVSSVDSVGSKGERNFARTLVYDSVYDKLFVATESYSGPSYIYSFSIVADGKKYELTNEGSLAMPLSGAELKVNHAIGFVVATAREAGDESISGMPVTSKGEIDPSRKSFYIPVSIKSPRPIEITEDGHFIAIASETTHNIEVLKLSFNSHLEYVSSEKIFSETTGSTGYRCSFSKLTP